MVGEINNKFSSMQTLLKEFYGYVNKTFILI